MSSCGGSATVSSEPVPSEVDVNGQKLVMTQIPGGSFSMGIRTNGRKVTGATVHQVLLDGYGISAQPVSQALWAAVMGSPASEAATPVESVSYKDALKFTKKLSKLTGYNFTLPTEAQWEYAVWSGVKAATNDWCLDTFVEEFKDSLVANPCVSGKSPVKVVRNEHERTGLQDYFKSAGLSFRVVVNAGEPCPDAVKSAMSGALPEREHSCKNENITVGGQVISMVAVKGGSFTIGETPGQGKYADDDEKPAHDVTVSDFELAKTEVTVGLWQEVMGYLPFKNDISQPKMPVINVSWYDCQEFLLKLNERTGRTFRLPTEAEWEFAARGGNNSVDERYAGSSTCALVAVYASENRKSDVTKVASMRPNELGLYDMSGNVWEWCQDTYHVYESSALTDPCYNDAGASRVMRGGSAESRWTACRVTNRSSMPASRIKSTFGFRLAL